MLCFYILGSRKSSDMDLIIENLEIVEESLPPPVDTQASAGTQHSVGDVEDDHPIFVSSETITMAKLHSLMHQNSGVYLNIIDEEESMFKSLETTSGHDTKDRTTWLTLFNGKNWTRSTKAGRKHISHTRLNYTGSKSLTPQSMSIVMQI